MKFLLLMLALATFSESQAFVLRDEPQSEMDRLRQEFRDYLKNVSRAVDEKSLLIANSKFYREQRNQLGNEVSRIIDHFSDQINELPNEVTQVGYGAYDILLGTISKAYNILAKTYDQAESFCEELLKSSVAPYVKPVLERVGPHTESLRHALITKTQEIDTKVNTKLKEKMEELETKLVPYTEKAYSQWQEFKTTLQPVANEIEEYFKNLAETINKNTAPFWKAAEDYLREFYELTGGPFIH